MVSGGVVNSDLSSVKTYMNQYTSEITGLSGNWKGDSYTNLLNQVDVFQSEFISMIEKEMNAFSAACDLYTEYKEVKSQKEAAEAAYQAIANSRENQKELSRLDSEIVACNQKLQSLKSEIESLLNSISGILSTDGASGASGISIPLDPIVSGGELTQQQIEQLIDYARSQIGQPYNSMHYGPKDGDNQGFGCAMFVSYCYNNVLFNGASAQEKGNGGFYGSCKNYWGNVTKDNFDAYNKGFIEVDASEAQPGDIVCFVNKGDTAGYHSAAENCYHVGLYLGDGKMIHSSKYITNGVGECSINQYISARGNGKGYRFLHYVGEQGVSKDEEDKQEEKQI